MSTKEEFLTTACLLSQGDGRITFGFITRLKIQVAPATVPCKAQVFARPLCLSSSATSGHEISVRLNYMQACCFQIEQSLPFTPAQDACCWLAKWGC